LNPADPTLQSPVAIIGMGCLFPQADDLGGYWSNLRHCRDAITGVPETHWRPADYYDADPKSPDRTYAHRGGFLTPVDFPPLDFGIAPNNIEATDTTQLLGLLVARRALEDAGYGEGSARPLDRERVSVILGVTGTLELVIPLGARLGHPQWRRALKDAGVAPATAEDVVRRIGESYVGWQENSFPGLLGNVAAGRIANRLDLGGTNCVVDAACASSLGAVNLALMELAAGRCDLALSGGLDTFNDIFMFMCFSKTPALSPRGDARPFDAGCDGTALGEGLGVLVLKRLADARRDGDRIYAVIRGVGSSSDGKGGAVYAPKAEGQARALRRAYAQAGVGPETVELLEAHGTGTKVGDATELAALNQVYGAAATAAGSDPGRAWCALGSVKSQIGHTKAAAGAAGLIKAALALHYKVLPPTIKVTTPMAGVEPGASPFYLNTEARPWLPRPGHPRRAAVSAFGFGGSNYHCVLEEADPAKPGADWDGETQVLAFSASGRDDLAALLREFPAGADRATLRYEAARSRRAFRADDPHRLVLVAGRETDLAALVESALGVLRQSGEVVARTKVRDGVFLGSGPRPGGLGLLFPGQGSQYPGMLRELACAFPEVQEALAAADAQQGGGGVRLSDRVYPHPAFTPEGRAAQDRDLRATEAAQPAIGALSLGLFRVLERFGVRPDAAAGHSFGELTALAAAGRLSTGAFHRLAAGRGRLMAEAAKAGGGSMVAVLATSAEVERVVRDEALGLVVANKNAPRQCVLSGPTAEVERAAKAFAARGLSTRPLAVSAAFHSPAVAAAAVPFGDALRVEAVAPGAAPVYANATAAAYPADPGEARALLAGQIARPVEFVAMVGAMARAGVGTFLEVGPDAKLAGLARAILDEPGAGRPGGSRVIAVDASKGALGNLHDLASALAELAALGYPVRLDRWDEGAADAPPPRKPGLTVKVSGANPRPRQADAPAAAPAPTAPPIPDPITPPVPKPPMTPTPRPQDQAVDGDPSPPPTPTTAPPAGARNGHAHEPADGRPAAVPRRDAARRPEHEPGAIAAALRAAHEGLAALQRLGEQTADLHRQFLDGQDDLQRSFQTLLERHRRLALAADDAPEPARPAPAAVVTPKSEPAPVSASIATPPPPRAKHEPGPRFIPPEPTPPPVAPSAWVDPNPPSVDLIHSPAVPPKPESRVEPRPAPASPPAAPAPDAPAARLGAPSAVRSALLDVVAEKTGYPADMLDTAMTLDADLGIDSIKRVEILSAIQERLPDAPQVRPEHLGTLHTLDDIIAFLDAAVPEIESVDPPPAAAGPLVTPGVQRLVLGSVRRGDREDAPVRPFRDGGTVWVADDGSGLARSLTVRLGERGYSARLVRWDTAEAPDRLDALLLVAPAGPSAGDRLVKDAFRWVRAAGPGLRRAGNDSGAALVTVGRFDGAFGLGEGVGGADVAAGGLAGLVKTAGLEWPEVRARAFDLDTAVLDPAAGAGLVLDELFRAGPIEVGLSEAGRIALELRAEGLTAGATDPIAPGDLMIVTGGARGVTAEAAVALAGAFRPTLVLIGRSPEPAAEADWLAPLRVEAEIKRALAARAGGGATPQRVGDEYRAALANREALQTLARVESQGARAVYRRVDVRDPVAVAAAVAEARRSFGPVRGLVHGAGVLADRRIEDQTDAQFADVYDTKVAGLDALLASAGDGPRLLAFFSSTTARLGRPGQVAYAAANEVLNKVAQREARRRPACRVVAINWGPWDGGMVTAAHKPLFAAEGVGLVPPQAGGAFLVAEVRASGASRPAEVVALVGDSIPPGLYGVQTGRVAEPRPEAVRAVEITPTPAPRPVDLTPVFDRALDLETLPILRSHVIDGRAVVPMALTLEWLAQGALQRNPGLCFCGVDGLRLFKGVVLHEGRPETLTVLAGRAVREGTTYRVPVELRGSYGGGADVAHARGEVVLGDRLPEAVAGVVVPAGLPAYGRSTRSVYDDVLFHGPGLERIERVETLGPWGVAAVAGAGAPPSEWDDRPLRQSWLSDPLALDCAFQLMTLWCAEQAEGGSLPTFVGRYRQFRRSFPGPRVRIAARVTRPAAHRALADITFSDGQGGVVAQIDGYECVLDASLKPAFRRNRLPEVARGAR